MIGASIYGFVDYRKTSHNKKFTTMYEAKDVVEPVEVIASEKKEAIVKKESTNAEKKMVTNNVVSDVLIKKDVEKSVVNNKAIKKLKKKKKFSTKLFSRGGLDDRYIEPKEKMIVPKLEVKKTEDKEQ
jgi:hypothetical protein